MLKYRLKNINLLGCLLFTVTNSWMIIVYANNIFSFWNLGKCFGATKTQYYMYIFPIDSNINLVLFFFLFFLFLLGLMFFWMCSRPPRRGVKYGIIYSFLFAEKHYCSYDLYKMIGKWEKNMVQSVNETIFSYFNFIAFANGCLFEEGKVWDVLRFGSFYLLSDRKY